MTKEEIEKKIEEATEKHLEPYRTSGGCMDQRWCQHDISSAFHIGAKFGMRLQLELVLQEFRDWDYIIYPVPGNPEHVGQRVANYLEARFKEEGGE